MHDDYYRLSRKQLKAYKEYSLKAKIVRTFVNTPVLYDLYLSLLNNHKLQFDFLQNQRNIRQKTHDMLREVEKQHEHELTSEEEIDSITTRIKYALEDREEH